MPKLSPELLESIIMDSIEHAAAPRHSAMYQRTPRTLDRLFQEGDMGDAWIVVAGYAETIIQTLGLRDQACVCGSSEHHPRVGFGLAPIGDDGQPDMTRGFFGDPAEAPEEVREARPDIVIFTQIMNAELRNDSEESMRLWRQAEPDGLWVRVLNFALKQAGMLRRRAIGASGVN
jgi:hypothetical protein